METPLSNGHPHRIFSSLITKFVSHKSRPKRTTGISNVCSCSGELDASRKDFEAANTSVRVPAALSPDLDLSPEMPCLFDAPNGHEGEDLSSYPDDMPNGHPSPLRYANDLMSHTHMSSRKGIVTSHMLPNFSSEKPCKSPNPDQHFHNMDAQLDDAFKALFFSKPKAIIATAPQASKPLVLTHVKPMSPRHGSPRKNPEMMQLITEESEEEEEDDCLRRKRSVSLLIVNDLKTPPMTPLKAANKAKCPQLDTFLESYAFFVQSSPSPADWSPRTPGSSP